MRQSIDNLHDSITEDVLRAKRIVVDVIDPGQSVWGETVEGLVTVIYECHETSWCKGCTCTTHKQPETGHAHHSLYGPHDERTDKPIERYTIYAD